ADQLYCAGITGTPFPDLSWAQADTSRFGLSAPYALLVPGGAPHRPGKRWSASGYGALAQQLAEQNIQPVLLGTDAEKDILDEITTACPEAKNLCGMTDIAEIAVLGRDAIATVGNDTGPMHVLAISGAPSVVLYSYESDPVLCAQRGPAVKIIRRKSLSEVSVDDVLYALGLLVPELTSAAETPAA
ncbi:MAG: glycosyltransferase family 9 protein, partial [Rhodospirillales bacterium]|nr:glycosyltransferase family 9 protein [Rhodospirillales bacterium]